MNLTATIDGLGNRTEMRYDALGKLSSKKDPEGALERYAYDGYGNLTLLTDGRYNETSYGYDAFGRLRSETAPGGAERRFDYDRLGRMTRSSDFLGRATLLGYDELGRPVAESRADGMTRSLAYDAVGNLVRSVDPAGTVTDNLYDGDYRLITSTRTGTGDKAGIVESSSYEYDIAGILMWARDGSVVTEYNSAGTGSGAFRPADYHSDPYGRVRRLTRYVGGTALSLEYDYDAMGRVTSVTYPDGRVVTQGYDTTGRLTAIPGYLSGSITYDTIGRPASWTMANGVEANQGYDGVGRIASLGYSGDDDIANFSFRYDWAGNMVLKNRSSYSYDSRNRLSLADEIGRYAADAREMGKATAYASLDATGERAMSHVALDAEIRLDQGAASVGIDLGASYEVATITATPLSATHRVEERNVAVFVSTYGSDYTEVDDWSFAILPDGSLYIRLAEPVKARYVKLHCRYDERDADGSVHDVSTFGNAARSLVTVGYHETSRRESYDYDDQGNRLYVETRLGSQTDSSAYSYYAGSDRVRTSGDRAYVYDQNGNMTERGTSYAFDGDDPIYEHDDYYRAYEYDLQNRLVKVSGYIDGVLTVLATYTYAGDNLRLTKTAGGVTTRYVHGVDGNELYRSTASDSVSTIWLFGRKLVEIEQASGTEERTYLHTDHLGSVVAATDDAGATIWRGDNSAFGVATADAGLESRTASYTGKDYDPEAGLYYFNARWYDAELGRFTTEDPARDDVNWYVYVRNAPLTGTDPSGLQEPDMGGSLSAYSIWASTGVRDSSWVPTPEQAAESVKRAKTDLPIMAAITIATVATGPALAAATEAVGSTSVAVSAAISGSFSVVNSMIMTGGSEALRDPNTYARAAVASVFGGLSGSISAGLKGVISAGTATPLLSAIAGNSITGMGSYSMQAAISDADTFSLEGLALNGAVNAAAGALAYGASSLVGSFASKTIREGTGTYYNPFTSTVSGPTSRGLEIMEEVVVNNSTWEAFGEIVVNPVVGETASTAAVNLIE